MSTTSATTTTTAAAPPAAVASFPRPGQKQKLRLACDACLNAKVRCDKQHPTCQRCAVSRRPCIYSPSRKSGRPASARKKALLAQNGGNATSTATATATAATLQQNPTSPRPCSPQCKHETTTVSAIAPADTSSTKSHDRKKQQQQLLGGLSPTASSASSSSASSNSGSCCNDSAIFLADDWLDFAAIASSTESDPHLLPDSAAHQWYDVSPDASCAMDFDPATADSACTSPDLNTIISHSPHCDAEQEPQYTEDASMFNTDIFNTITGSHPDAMDEDLLSPETLPEQDQGCPHDIFSIFASLQNGPGKQPLAQRRRPDYLAMSTSTNLAPPARSAWSLDQVLDTNKTAVNSLVQHLDCPCAHEPHLALLYASIVSKVLHWYQVAASRLRPQPAADGESSPQLDIHIPMHLGSFALDEAEQMAFTRQLILSEVRKVDKVIAKMARAASATATVNQEEHQDWEASAMSRYAFACVTLRSELQQTIKRVSQDTTSTTTTTTTTCEN